MSGFSKQEVSSDDIHFYKRDLAKFDWGYQYTNDPIAVNDAKRALRSLLEKQKKFDPSGKIWKQYQPVYGPEPVVYT